MRMCAQEIEEKSTYFIFPLDYLEAGMAGQID